MRCPWDTQIKVRAFKLTRSSYAKVRLALYCGREVMRIKFSTPFMFVANNVEETIVIEMRRRVTYKQKELPS